MRRIAYYRVSTRDQSIEAQRAAMGGKFDREFQDEGLSGGTLAASRPEFAKLLAFAWEGDEVCVYAVDRLGRDAIDVQETVRTLLDRGVTLNVHGLGPLNNEGAGQLILSVLAQVATMEKRRIAERTADGRARAQQSLRETGQTHRGKTAFGRPVAMEAATVRNWRQDNGKSIADAAAHFGISTSTVKRYCVDPLARA